MIKQDYIFRKVQDIDKVRFAELLSAAKGGRTMKDFAADCGVNPSTFTRIMQMANKGASSPELLEAIAQHADPASGVTLEALADANGYRIRQDDRLRSTHLFAQRDNTERLIRNVLVQELLDRGQQVRMGSIRYDFSKSLSLRPDALIMTDAFGKENEVWFVDSIANTPYLVHRGNPKEPEINQIRVKQMAFDKLSRFVFIGMNKIDLFRPGRFSLVVLDPAIYEIIVEEFAETNVPTDISIILIDPLNNCISDEYILPHTELGNRDSYFMTTQPVVDDYDYLSTDFYDEE